MELQWFQDSSAYVSISTLPKDLLNYQSKHMSLQTSQNFLLQKMLQKTSKICVIMSAFFEPWNEGKIWDLFKNFQLKKILRNAQVSLAFFDVVNCNNECKPVKPQLSKNHEKTCTFLKIFLSWEILNRFHIFIQFFESKNHGKIGHTLRFFWNIFWIRKFWDVCSV